MKESNWTIEQIPDLTGRVVVVTGATSGLGAEAADVLAGKNATVVMAVRDTEKGERVATNISDKHPGAEVIVSKLDLANLSSVSAFSAKFLSDFDRIDLLINNAGVMFCDYRATEDGFEPQMGTNHFGHFALTGRLLPLLKDTANSRVVVTSSVAHRSGKIDIADINWKRRKYNTTQAYCDSKIANLFFCYELSRRLKKGGGGPTVTVAHPGWTRSELQRHSGMMRFLNKFFSQGPEMGVLPTLRAAFDQSAMPGDYFGPSKLFETHGYPVVVSSSKRSHDRDVARQLWDLSEKMTGVTYA